jgi:hypothetical protein
LSWTLAESLINKRTQISGKKCRLPTVSELQRLVDSEAFTHREKSMLFPPISIDWRWTGTRIFTIGKGSQYNYANNVLGRKNENPVQIDLANAWAVNITTGEARKDVSRRTQMPVQYVCAASN